MSGEKHEVAVLGGGCFWCLEAVYKELEGVASVTSGYAGGDRPNPSYEQVCSGATGHAEVVRIEYNPEVVSFRNLLEVFFTIHDPTQLNRQGNDVGTQYRSVIFCQDDTQRSVAEAVMGRLSADGVWSSPIVTELAPAPPFYPAEDYHQDYFDNHPGQPYCQVVVAPKVAKARKKFAERLRRKTS